ncbi:MAG TPA: 3-methyl-2-oxobutanoate hydroxymethyltransferase [Brevundimonas sp.]|uniref:3-methyl-2-oxobutanoate hydroxymethyltransferase n=1 Tax=Brevundimonas sp. TaxID=1871086 RepID=UPI002C7C7928|nr:3-methyl-2-oxobutanoate hydroxymethyltransferase [Brevundimonas sp.]HRH20241.1 3-methyl-2-oxobutanoate hydroxymethyltransferase [Brevundimonas sp.]
MRTTPFDLARLKAEGRRWAMLTAYDYSSALIAEAAGVPVLLVGDSMGNVVHGRGDTLSVTVDDIVRASQSVVRGTQAALVVADMPFLSFRDDATAIASAGRMLSEGGAGAVKLEGGGAVVAIVRRLVELGIPVMGHLGFTPQSAGTIGLKVQAKDVEGARRLIADAEALQAAGAFALVLELVPAQLAAEVSRRLTIPVIGIGAGPECDAQVQVWHDLLGLFDGRSPRHARRFAEIGQAMREAVAAYVGEVEAGSFPTDAQSSRKMEDGALDEALGSIYGRGG